MLITLSESREKKSTSRARQYIQTILILSKVLLLHTNKCKSLSELLLFHRYHLSIKRVADNYKHKTGERSLQRHTYPRRVLDNSRLLLPCSPSAILSQLFPPRSRLSRHFLRIECKLVKTLIRSYYKMGPCLEKRAGASP